jgi:hypothetical protein
MKPKKPKQDVKDREKDGRSVCLTKIKFSSNTGFSTVAATTLTFLEIPTLQTSSRIFMNIF